DVVEAAVRIADVTQDDAVVRSEPTQCRLVAHVVAFEVVDGKVQHAAGLGEGRERGPPGLYPATHRLAEEAQAGVLLERAGGQPGLGQHLEAVTDPHYRTAGGREPRHRLHHG